MPPPLLPPDPGLLDPDVRFLLANERTLLAWIRTALALMAGGLALVQLSAGHRDQVVIGLATIALAALMAVIGYWRFRAADQAIRAHRLPRMGRGPVIQVVGVVVFAVLIIVLGASRLAG